MALNIQHFFEPHSSTFSYVVSDSATHQAAIVDAVLHYDLYSGTTSTEAADEIIQYIKQKQLNVAWLLDTHIHADHITATHYLKQQLGGTIGIGAKIKDVLELWVPVFNTGKNTDIDASQFDHTFLDGETFALGKLTITVMYTPGHTPACLSYLVGDAIFVGDTLLMPDLGTARTDFPGGSAEDMYDSVQKILNLPDETRIFLCHDYPENRRPLQWQTTVKQQKTDNALVGQNTTKQQYVAARNKRDEGKPVPKMLLPSIQTNLRAGSFGTPENNGVQYVKVPVDQLKRFE